MASYVRNPNLVDSSSALAYFGIRRTRNAKGVTIPSQMRYVHYFDQYCKLKRRDMPQPGKTTLFLTGVRMHGQPKEGSDVHFTVESMNSDPSVTQPSVFLSAAASDIPPPPPADSDIPPPPPPDSEPALVASSSNLAASASATPESNDDDSINLPPNAQPLHWSSAKFVSPQISQYSVQIVTPLSPSSSTSNLNADESKSEKRTLFYWDLNSCTLPLSEDIRVSFQAKTSFGQKKLFHFWINTRFLRPSSVGADGSFILRLTKAELDKACKDSSNKKYPAYFSIELVFAPSELLAVKQTELLFK